MRKRKLQAQNLQGYLNSQSGVEKAGDTTRGIRPYSIQAGGALTSSKAEITVARFDTVPLIRNLESNHWFGNRKRGN